MLSDVIKLTDKLYKSGKEESKTFKDDIGFLYKYDTAIDRYRLVLSVKNEYSFLNISDFYFTHTQRVLFDNKDDKLSDVLYFFFVLVSSFDIDQMLDRYKYNLLKNVLYGYVNIEECYLSILQFHPVNDEDKQLFSFKRDSNNELEVFYKSEKIDFIGLIIAYLESVKLIENKSLLKKFSISFLTDLFSSKLAIEKNFKETKNSSLRKVANQICNNEINIIELYSQNLNLYLEILERSLKYIQIDDSFNFDSSFNLDTEVISSTPTNYKEKYISEYFLETSFLLFFNSQKEIDYFIKNLNTEESKRVFLQLIKFKCENY